MKNLFGLLFILAVVFSCSDDDAQSNSHLGEWNLDRSSGGIVGANDEFDAGDVRWDFVSENLLVISNQYVGSNIYPGHVSGSYTYLIIKNNRGEFLSFDGSEQGEIEVINNVLTINSNRYSEADASDGITFEFSR